MILARGLLCLFTANATTRHNVWVSVLLLLLFLPLQSFITPYPQVNILNAKLGSYSNELLTEITSTPARTISDAERLGPIPADQPNPTSAGETNPPSTHWRDSLWQNTLEFFSNSRTLSWIGILLSFLLLTGALFRIVTTIRSYQDLRRLVASSEAVSGKPYSRLTKLTTYIKLNRAPKLKHNSQVRNPLAAGIFRPTIILPSHMTKSDVSKSLLDQVLLHELAHIKRRDTIIVLLQLVASIFLFWHPAVRYINRKISFERELACDDWVINYGGRNRSELAGSYATNLVELSKSLRHNSLNLHSLAWLQSTHVLKARVRFLLDSSLDHSTGTYGRFCLLMLCSMMVLPVAWTPVWPQYPFPSQVAAESLVAGELELGQEINPIISNVAETNTVEANVTEPVDSSVPGVNEEQPALIDVVREELPVKPIADYQPSDSFETGLEPLQIQISPRDSAGQLWAAGLEPIQLMQEIKKQLPEAGQEYIPSGTAQLSMTCGADIVLQAPCRVTLVHENFVRL
ncbi:MAG: M56 family metallopeptidase, partial [Pseudomonadales bacterium]|nr:M56 family metallopeptidase [Pseudomonadales bacterium]